MSLVEEAEEIVMEMIESNNTLSSEMFWPTIIIVCVCGAFLFCYGCYMFCKHRWKLKKPKVKSR